MGGDKPEREEARARTAYVVAARRFSAAVASFVATGVPIAPRSSSDTALPPWQRVDIAVMLELQEALAELIRTRKTYDLMRQHR